ncbi:MAG: hypothetical protein V3V07_07995 [candidate division NC10 bacterium]|jgi:uncharacterized protein YxjI
MAVVKELVPAFQHRKYMFRRQVFTLFGGAFHVDDALGRRVLYSQQKAFTLREDFRVYSDENQMQELSTIKTPQILDISATYDVYDAIFQSLCSQIQHDNTPTGTANRSKAFDCGRNPMSRY